MAGAVAEKLESIQRHAGVKGREIALMLASTPQTVSRWRNDQVSPQPNRLRQLLALEWIADQLAEFFEPDQARVWLMSHHPLLDGDRPADRIAQGDTDNVVALIDQLRDGAHL
jgi:transcriptional regulator with XRE-family HTH domain